MIYALILLVVLFFIWYVFKNESNNNKEFNLNDDFPFSTEDKLFVAPIKAETTQDRQDLFNESYIRYKKKFNAKLKENQKETEIMIEEKSEIKNIKEEAIHIIEKIQTNKRKGIKGILEQIVEQKKD